VVKNTIVANTLFDINFLLEEENQHYDTNYATITLWKMDKDKAMITLWKTKKRLAMITL